MKIEFQTTSLEIQTLTDDLEYLKNTLGLPCNFNKIVNASEQPRYPNNIAMTFFVSEGVKTGIPIVEINTQYYEYDRKDRILILLHEIIHCCQRANKLKLINDKYSVQLTNSLNSQIDKILKTHDKDNKFYVFQSSLIDVGMFASWIFEIWDEIHLKENYSKIFERSQELTFKSIDQGIDIDTIKCYGDWAKYLVFINLVRAFYLKKITKDFDISKKYDELYERWKEKLQSIINQNEYNELMNHLDNLTDIDAYYNSDTYTMEESYDKLITKMVNDATRIVER